VNVSKIALGTVQFGIDYGVNSVDGQVKPEEVKKILSYAHSKNIDLLDTAPAYGNSEKILGRMDILNFKVVTKTRHFDSLEIKNNDVKLLNNDFHHSLKNLKQDSVYGVLIHNAGDLFKPGAEKLFDQLQELKQAKKIVKIGVSVYDHSQLQSILDNFDIDLVQLPFNILDRRMIDSSMLATLRSKSTEVHVRSVFLQGLLLMSEQNRPDKFNRWSSLWKIWHEWLNDNQITALEATIRHAVSMPEISKVLVGVDTADQLKEIFISSSGGLPNIPDELFTNDADLLNPSNWGKL
jgi:aryl-alcohol dehydrogenase-like predicted oxidoreductase